MLATIEDEPCNQEELISTKFEKKFISKLLELCRTRTKKSSLDMLNFYLLSAACDMVTDNDSSTTCRRKVQVSIIKNKYKKWKTFRKHGFPQITNWRF